jgi:hypothetical protein
VTSGKRASSSGRGRRADQTSLVEGQQMMKPIALAAAICALTACSVPMQTVDASRAACASYGFQPTSDAFANCVMTEQHRHTLVIYGGGAGGPVADGFRRAIRPARCQFRGLHRRGRERCLPRNAGAWCADGNLSRPDGRRRLHRADVLIPGSRRNEQADLPIAILPLSASLSGCSGNRCGGCGSAGARATANSQCRAALCRAAQQTGRSQRRGRRPKVSGLQSAEAGLPGAAFIPGFRRPCGASARGCQKLSPPVGPILLPRDRLHARRRRL